jgi:hypothetical protein
LGGGACGPEGGGGGEEKDGEESAGELGHVDLVRFGY